MKSLYAKLLAIQTKWVQVSKDWVNPHFKSKYMTLDNIIETLAPLLKEQWLLVTHFIDQQELVTRVVDVESGESLNSSFGLLATDPQKKGSEVTYAKRYNLSALFNICSDEDDDGNSVSWNNAPISNDVPQMPTKYPKSALDEVMEQMEIETDMEHLKTLYNLWLDRVKSEKQKAFFESFKEKQKKRILSLNVHTA